MGSIVLAALAGSLGTVGVVLSYFYLVKKRFDVDDQKAINKINADFEKKRQRMVDVKEIVKGMSPDEIKKFLDHPDRPPG